MTAFRTGAAVAIAVTLAGCGAATDGSGRTGAAPRPSAIATAQVRADAFATVAARLYQEESAGPAGRRNAARIAHDQGLLRALAAGRPAAIRAAALRELFLPVKHVVRIRVVRAGRTIVDVGGAFVAGSQSTELRAPDGTGLGRLDISMQDVLGLTKLEQRFTGAAIVVHGARGHVIASDPALAGVPMPGSGTVRAGGRTYVVRSFQRTGFAGEPLRISVLVPA